MGEKKIIWVGTIREATSTELNRFDSHCTKSQSHHITIVFKQAPKGYYN